MVQSGLLRTKQENTYGVLRCGYDSYVVLCNTLVSIRKTKGDARLYRRGKEEEEEEEGRFDSAVRPPPTARLCNLVRKC